MRMSWMAGGALAALLATGPALAQKTTLVIGMQTQDAGVLDPHINSGTPGKALLNWMFNGLVRIKPGQASPDQIEPDIAESWTSSADGKEWTFKLRQGVQCHHDLGEFTAEDAVFSLQRAGSKDSSAFSSDYSAFDKVEAVDKYTVRITLKTPIPSLLGQVMNYHGGNMVCKKAVDTLGKDGFARKPAGTGPFVFAEYVPQQYVKLVANPKYFRGEPKIKEIIYRFIPSDAARDLALQAGEIDMMIGRQEQAWVDRTNKIPGLKVIAFGPAEMSVIHLNMTQPPLDNIKVRQAIAHAIDRAGIQQFRGPAISRQAVSVVPSGYFGTHETAPLLPHNLARAKQLLTEAGFPNGVTIKAIHTTLPGMMGFIEATQAQLKRAGITLDITPVEHPTFHQQIRQDLSQLVHFQAARFPIADVYLTQFFHSRSIVKTPTAVTNFSHCKVADAEIDAARTEQDKAKQVALWKTAQEKIINEVCAVPVNEMLMLWAFKDSLDLGYELKGSLNLGPPITEQTRFTK
ncbi:MAG: ABC transporter substrate-binding protein [Beijerinckiaceae bacterium]|nr:ABC transporter substrate-binding protein [Beijerinckiaceae bacterium]MCZ8300168.1 ABC transporter substrate-binding protein [Beijerinckiaceae bacterium]